MYRKLGRQYGPYTHSEMLALSCAGKVALRTLVRQDSADWTWLGRIPELRRMHLESPLVTSHPLEGRLQQTCPESWTSNLAREDLDMIEHFLNVPSFFEAIDAIETCRPGTAR